MIAKIILLCLMFSEYAISVVKRGEDKGKYNPTHALFGIIIMLILLYFAGFFNGVI